VATIR